MRVKIRNLSGSRGVDVREAEHEYHVKVETITPSGACPACHGVETVGHGCVKTLVDELRVQCKEAGVYVDATRLHCQGCGRTFAALGMAEQHPRTG